MIDKNLKNPLFESLLQKARKVEEDSEHTGFHILEQDQKSADPKMVKAYVNTILDELWNSMINFTGSIPDQSLKDKALPELISSFQKLSTNSTVDDLFKALGESWKSVMGKMGQIDPKIKDAMTPIYANVDQGINKLLEAYEKLKSLAGDKIMDPEIISSINEKMPKMIESLSKTIETAKNALSKK